MASKILTANQLKILSFIGQESLLAKSFYLSGGTALAGFYLQHRYSEDLDFFNVNVNLKTSRKNLSKVSYFNQKTSKKQ